MKYFNPPNKLPELGRKLETPSTWENLTSQLMKDEMLFGLFDRGLFFNAPHLDTEYCFNEFNRQRKEGLVTLKGFFAVPANKLTCEGGWDSWIEK